MRAFLALAGGGGHKLDGVECTCSIRRKVIRRLVKWRSLKTTYHAREVAGRHVL